MYPTLKGMVEPPYPVARFAATRIHDHVAGLLEGSPGPLVDIETLEAAINVAFWASLRREEGITPRVSLAFLPPDRVTRPPIMLEPPLALTAHSLTRVAPAVLRPGIHLGVWRKDSSDLATWGATHHLPPFSLVLEIVAPGLMVVKYTRGEESGKFVNLVVIESDEVKVIDQQAANLLAYLTSEELGDVLMQLAVSMRGHGRGGTLLVVPSHTECWRESILSPPLYLVSPPYTALGDLARKNPSQRQQRKWQDALRRDIDGVAGLTAVDGATILNDKFEVLGFGAKIIRRGAAPQITHLTATEPIEGAVPVILEPAQLGGTRHLSAAQFTQDQRDAIAMVASQDGRFTVFGWSPAEQMVRAHRVETLLL